VIKILAMLHDPLRNVIPLTSHTGNDCAWVEMLAANNRRYFTNPILGFLSGFPSSMGCSSTLSSSWFSIHILPVFLILCFGTVKIEIGIIVQYNESG
jgi:hypothetical protein